MHDAVLVSVLQRLADWWHDRQRLLEMTPASYIGKAAELAKRI